MNDSPQPHCSSKKKDQIIRSTTGKEERGLTYVGVPEHKSLIQFVFYPVHLTADDAEQSLAIDQNLHSVLFYSLIESACFIHILEVICQPRTSSVLDTNPDKLRFWQGKKPLDLTCS